jgi:hypothetical protein
MSHLQRMLWLCVGAYGIHIVEEFIFNWKAWARGVLHLPAEWPDFYMTNALVIVLGIVAVEIAPAWPAVALGFPALMLINACFFHVAPILWTRGRFSPGAITAVLLFFPLGFETMRTPRLPITSLVLSFAVGMALMFTPISFLILSQKPYFKQNG